MLKRVFDLLASLFGIVLVSPAIACVACLIKLEDGGPVFYPGVRTGQYGRPFRMLKFRTMVVNADQLGASSTADNDSRITRIGRFLRRSKLDEIPQLFNVLRGEMSVVGPRPEVPAYTNIFAAEERKILDVRPGITDWASIWNSNEGALLRNAPDPDRTYFELIRPTKLKLQLRYVERSSFREDLRILLFTFVALIKGRDYVVRRVPELRT